MTIAAKYNPQQVEDKWYAYWMKHGFFSSRPNPDKESYCIVIPPPNVTGVLHMGHMLNNTIQDVLVRRARMLGKEAVWVPGYDHASIATEAKVVAMLKEKGIEKKEIGRETFLEYAEAWKDKHGGIILEQLKKLGASCDWERTRYTMEPELYDSVIQVFVALYEKGLIYRGLRMVNWDPQGKTALSDDEVIYREVQSKLYFVKYALADGEEYVTIATTRPETILGDTAVCVNPKDERYRHLKGKNVKVPLINREIPVIEDDYVSMDFGTGCLKITPSHDPNDYEIGERHQLPSIDIFNDDGTLSEAAERYIGTDRFEARDKIVKDLEEAGHLEKVEDYVNNVGFSERTDAVIEPRLSTQWFLKMEDITKPALHHVINDDVQLIPAKFKNMYRHWMENVRDWCISRQLWWGHRIPAYYLPDGRFVVSETREKALELAKKLDPEITENQLKQDEDVLDTWFSSWLWPITVFNGILEPDNEEIAYYYPTNDLVTAPEILFFWVARMIIAGYEFRDEKPFRHVYLTGIVRDKQRRKMSKSLGNSPDPLELISTYSADGVRVGMLLSSPAGNDLLFDEKLTEQGRNFANKIWNAFRLIKGLQVDENAAPVDPMIFKWMDARISQALMELEDHFGKFRISDALMVVYKLIWDDYCSWFLEMIKPLYGENAHPDTLEHTFNFFDQLMRILHPFMPFISEEIWQQLQPRKSGDSLMIATWPRIGQIDQVLIEGVQHAFEVVSQIRNMRAQKNLSPKDRLVLHVKTTNRAAYMDFAAIIKKLGNIEDIRFDETFEGPGATFIVRADECFIPLEGKVDTEAQAAEIQKELEYTRGFLQSVNKKLENERFVNNAPTEVVEKERQKKTDAEAKIRTLEESLSKML